MESGRGEELRVTLDAGHGVVCWRRDIVLWGKRGETSWK